MAKPRPKDYKYAGNDGPIGAEVIAQPSDTVNLRFYSRYLYVGAAGDVSVEMMNGTTALLTAVPKGTMLKIRIARVNAMGTSASAMVSFY